MSRYGWILIAHMQFGLAVPASVAAQVPGSVELGIDAGASLSFFDSEEGAFGISSEPPNLLLVSIPKPIVRAGLFVTEDVEIEPSLSVQTASQGDETITVVNFGFSVLYNLPRSDTSEPMSFIQFGTLIERTSYSNGRGGDESASNLGFAAAIGTRLLIADRLQTRLQIGGARFFEDPGAWQLLASMGFSFFSK